MRKCKEIVNDMMDEGYLVEESLHGANAYTVSNIGLAHMEAYLDIRREM